MTPTVLVGLDGGTFTVLDSLFKIGRMPFLKQFLAQGTPCRTNVYHPSPHTSRVDIDDHGESAGVSRYI